MILKESTVIYPSQYGARGPSTGSGQRKGGPDIESGCLGLEYKPGDAYLTQRMITDRDSAARFGEKAELAFEKEWQYQYFRGRAE